MIRALLFMVALASGGITALLVSAKQPDETSAEKAASAAPATAMDEVLVAARTLDRGAALAAADLRWQAWPADAVADGYVVRSQRPEAAQTLAGSVLRGAVVAGEPVATGKLAPAGASLLSAILSPGMRAVAIPVSAEKTAGGFILPEDRVDVMLTRACGRSSGCGADLMAQTILRGVRVLAIDQSGSEDGSSSRRTLIGKTATLEVRPDQAETLVGAQTMGSISLVLRAASDHDVVDVSTPRPERHVVRVLRNGASQAVSVH